MSQLIYCAYTFEQVCNEDFFTLDTLKVHLRTHLADDALKCWLCHFITENKDQFTEHMFTQHAVQLQVDFLPFTSYLYRTYGKCSKISNIFLYQFSNKIMQGLHRLENYLTIQDCLEKSLRLKFALKST